MNFLRWIVFVAVFCMGSAAIAEPVPFDREWKEQGFLRFFTNDYALRGDRLEVRSNGTVSLIWRQLDPGFGDADRARWQWQVQEGVGPTDLTQKGGDDRNLAVYFIFVDQETAKSPGSVRRLLRNANTRAMVYVWGGSHSKGAILPSPYSNKLRTKVLRGPGTGSFAEDVDLNADYRRAFGQDPGVLIGVAITADSDDTDGRIRAQIGNLRIE
jgi:hypothetical protein